MSDQTFYIFRHGIATHSLNGYGDQALTAGLLPEAYPAVNKLADFLTQFQFDLCLTSPVLRCQQTAQIVGAKIGHQFKTDERLSEYWPEVFPPFRTRVLTLAHELQREPVRRIAICTHGGVIAGLTRFLRDQDFDQTQLTDHPEPAGLVIVKTGMQSSQIVHLFADVR